MWDGQWLSLPLCLAMDGLVPYMHFLHTAVFKRCDMMVPCVEGRTVELANMLSSLLNSTCLMSLISISPTRWWSGAQGLVVGAVSDGTRDSEGLEWHGEDLAVCLFQRATADFLRRGECLSSCYVMISETQISSRNVSNRILYTFLPW